MKYGRGVILKNKQKRLDRRTQCVYSLNMKMNHVKEIIEAAKQALLGKIITVEQSMTIGSGSKSYTSDISYTSSGSDRAEAIINGAYDALSELDRVAIRAGCEPTTSREKEMLLEFADANGLTI